jgi:hypothetical protein
VPIRWLPFALFLLASACAPDAPRAGARRIGGDSASARYLHSLLPGVHLGLPWHVLRERRPQIEAIDESTHHGIQFVMLGEFLDSAIVQYYFSPPNYPDSAVMRPLPAPATVSAVEIVRGTLGVREDSVAYRLAAERTITAWGLADEQPTVALHCRFPECPTCREQLLRIWRRPSYTLIVSVDAAPWRPVADSIRDGRGSIVTTVQGRSLPLTATMMADTTDRYCQLTSGMAGR